MIMCSCGTLLCKIIFLIFVYNVYGYNTSQSALPDSLKYYKEGELLAFGIKTLTKETIVNTHLYLTLVLNTRQYQCQLHPVEAPHWPYIWYWCNMEHIATSYCENNNYEDDYSIIISNEADTPIFVDFISVVTEQGTIKIGTFYGKNINLGYPSIRPEENNGLVFGTIAINHMSIMINFEKIIEERAYNITIIEQHEIAKCTSDTEPWFVLVATESSWHDAEKHCVDMYHTHLVTIDTDNKLKLIFEASSQYEIAKAWIGLTYINSSWVWTDGTSCGYADEGNCANDVRWDKFEPTEYPDELCVHVTANNGYFNNNDCSMPFAFFCAIPSNISVSSLVFKTTYVPNINPTNNSNNQIINGTVIFILLIIGVIICCVAEKYYCKDRRRDIQYEAVSEQATNNSSSQPQFDCEHCTKSSDVPLSLETGQSTEIPITTALSVMENESTSNATYITLTFDNINSEVQDGDAI